MPTEQRIALLVGRHSDYARDVLRGIAAFARPDQPWVFRFFADLRGYGEATRWRADGAFVFLGSAREARAAEAAPFPSINIGQMAFSSRIPAVGNDDAALGSAGAQALLDVGVRRAAFFGYGKSNNLVGRERGFRAAMAAADVPVASGVDGSDREVARWLRSLAKPCGIMATSTGLAWRLSEIARDVGVRIPEDVALIGCDDELDLCALAYPAISVVRCNTLAIGREAARQLARRLAGERVPRAVLLPPIGIAWRQSTDLAAAGDPIVAAAVATMKRHRVEGVSIGRLASELAVSRRVLEERFRRWLGRGPAAELRRLRLERARELLATTDDKVAAIARSSGFSGARQLERALRRAYGKPPAAWRNGTSQSSR